MKKIFAMMIVAAGCMVFASCAKTEEKKDGAAAEGTEQVAEGENAEEAPVENEGNTYEADVVAVAEIIKKGNAAAEAEDLETLAELTEQLKPYEEKYGKDKEFEAAVMELVNAE